VAQSEDRALNSGVQALVPEKKKKIKKRYGEMITIYC
jgi:hypothetical protein